MYTTTIPLPLFCLLLLPLSSIAIALPAPAIGDLGSGVFRASPGVTVHFNLPANCPALSKLVQTPGSAQADTDWAVAECKPSFFF